MDGHANPLFLLRALQTGLQLRGGTYAPDRPVSCIRKEGSGYRIEGGGKAVYGERVILAAGLGNRILAPKVGIEAPLVANRGQVLITERVARILDIPTPFVRQTGDGTLQLGDSHEDVGMDDGTLTRVFVEIAQRSLNDFPILRNVRVIRGWGCLRIMTPDGYPIYQESDSHPGVFMACCHSGVTLAAVHANPLAAWIAGGKRPQETMPLHAERFNVQTPVTA
jgi:glycine/D-amino acid oxidase-like deaminating enzyme